MQKLSLLAIAAASALILSACGGGDGAPSSTASLPDDPGEGAGSRPMAGECDAAGTGEWPRPSTIARWEQTSIQGDFAIVRRSKTEVDIAIPLDLRLDTIGLSLRDVITRCKRAGVVSRYLIHHIKPSGSTKRGAPIALNGVSSAFAEARVLAGLTEVGAPTFHEIRSLTSRLYKAQGNVDTKALLGHLSDSAANTYQNPRGIEPIKVAVTTR